MKTIDARKLPTEVQQHNRNQAIRLFQQGKARQEIAEIVGVHYGVVCRWIRAWKEGGKKGLEIKKRGRDLLGRRESKYSTCPHIPPELNPDEYLNSD